MRTKYTVLILVCVCIIAGTVLRAEDPKIPRFWWNAVKAYIDEKSSAQILALRQYGAPVDQTLAVFTPSTIC